MVLQAGFETKSKEWDQVVMRQMWSLIDAIGLSLGAKEDVLKVCVHMTLIERDTEPWFLTLKRLYNKVMAQNHHSNG